MVTTYIVFSLVSGILFGVMDGLINSNPLGVKLNAVYKPIARTTLNLPVGILIDLVYGFVMAGIFLVLYLGLPGGSGLLKGVSFGLLAWFFRVLMSAASHWMMLKIPLKSAVYTTLTGLGEMLILGVLYGLTLHP